MAGVEKEMGVILGITAFRTVVHNVPDPPQCEPGGSMSCSPFVYLFIILFSASAKLDIGVEPGKRAQRGVTDSCDLVTRQ